MSICLVLIQTKKQKNKSKGKNMYGATGKNPNTDKPFYNIKE